MATKNILITDLDAARVVIESGQSFHTVRSVVAGLRVRPHTFARVSEALAKCGLPAPPPQPTRAERAA